MTFQLIKICSLVFNNQLLIISGESKNSSEAQSLRTLFANDFFSLLSIHHK